MLFPGVPQQRRSEPTGYHGRNISNDLPRSKPDHSIKLGRIPEAAEDHLGIVDHLPAAGSSERDFIPGLWFAGVDDDGGRHRVDGCVWHRVLATEPFSLPVLWSYVFLAETSVFSLEPKVPALLLREVEHVTVNPK